MTEASSSIRRTEYDSGLRLITERMPAVRSVTLGVWVTIGSRDEEPRIAGASHFLEHLLFKGTRKRTARDIAEAFDTVGGDLNAFTARENTTYYCRILDKDLPMAVEHLADMLLDSVIRPADLDAERQVILEEIHMHDDSPDEVVHDLFSETMWGDHPLGRPVLGTVETVSAVSRDQVRRFWKKHYLPENFAVVAAGNLDHDETARLLAGCMEVGEPVHGQRSRVREAGPVPESPGRAVVRTRETEQAHICIGAPGLARSDPRRFAFGLVNSALGGGMSSRLFQEVREKRGLVYSVFSYHQMYAETGVFTVYAGTTPSRAGEVLDIVTRELADIAEKGVTSEELDRAKTHMKGSLALSLEDSGGRMSRLGKSEIGHGEILSLDQIFERVDAVTTEDARVVAEEVLARPRTVAVVGPFDEGAFDRYAGAPA
ncbi:MAG TPA: pitrilysin family protein [Actinomycetota bacterium]|nr:pitrilysin family protein [Actinomycetota bacterium]